MRKLGIARTIAVVGVGIAATTAVATPIGIYFNTSEGVRYLERTASADVEYGSPLLSPPNFGDGYIATVLSNNYSPNLPIGSKDVQVVFVYSPRAGQSLPPLRCTVSLNVVKATAVPRDITIKEQIKQGSTVLPVLDQATLPDPPAGFARPWSAPSYTIIRINDPEPLTAAQLPKLRAKTVFTATYTANVDDSRYKGSAATVTKFLVAYTVVA